MSDARRAYRALLVRIAHAHISEAAGAEQADLDQLATLADEDAYPVETAAGRSLALSIVHDDRTIGLLLTHEEELDGGEAWYPEVDVVGAQVLVRLAYIAEAELIVGRPWPKDDAAALVRALHSLAGELLEAAESIGSAS